MINSSPITYNRNKVKITRNYEKSDYILNILKAEYIEDYKIELTFSDGFVRIVDFWPFLKKQLNPMTTKYRDLDKFKEFKLYYGNLDWNNSEMCFSIEDLYKGKL